MAWQLRHEGSPRVIDNLTLQQIADGLRDGLWESTDEIRRAGEHPWQRIESHPQLAEVAEELEALRQPPRPQEATSLDMNALIDVCLVLLIFFILTTSYTTMVQKVVPLPMVRADGTKARVIKADEVQTRMIRLQTHLDAQGKPVVRVENQTVQVLDEQGRIDPDRLTEALRPYARGADRKTEVLLDAREVSWETVIQIQDAARAAGIQMIHHLMRK